MKVDVVLEPTSETANRQARQQLSKTPCASSAARSNVLEITDNNRLPGRSWTSSESVWRRRWRRHRRAGDCGATPGSVAGNRIHLCRFGAYVEALHVAYFDAAHGHGDRSRPREHAGAVLLQHSQSE